jgi:hypothetical protein
MDLQCVQHPFFTCAIFYFNIRRDALGCSDRGGHSGCDHREWYGIAEASGRRMPVDGASGHRGVHNFRSNRTEGLVAGHDGFSGDERQHI